MSAKALCSAILTASRLCWARWDPDYLLKPEGVHEIGLNSLQAFSFLETAAHFTNNPKFAAAEKQILAWGYADNVLRQKIAFPQGWITHFDDRLAFLAFYPLLTYETDPALKARWLRSFERSWRSSGSRASLGSTSSTGRRPGRTARPSVPRLSSVNRRWTCGSTATSTRIAPI